AADFIDSNIDVVIGGGLNHFDVRKDGRKITEEMQKKGFAFFNNLPKDASQYKKLLVLIDTVHPPSILKGRGDLLLNGTKLALQSLSKNKNGFFLMVEGSQIDWSAHDNDSASLINEMIDFDNVVGMTMKYADDNPGTLVVITADHETGGLTFVSKKKSKIVKFHFSSDDHSAVVVPVFAYGTGAKNFTGYYDNTDIFHKILKTAGINK
ncbi:MAG: alkaline phosphatase, partial [Flavobacteriaceae bacterium]|nr:alkaline phosphatase [Flavobacteriaceae bacterium]